MRHSDQSLPVPGQDKKTSLIFLSLLCFSMADVRDGLGPFLGVYLQNQNWQPDSIGYVATIGGLAGMLFTPLMGALADNTRRKRLILAVAAVGLLFACGFVFIAHGVLPIAGAEFWRGPWERLSRPQPRPSRWGW